MAKGAVVSIHVSDPQALLKPVTGPIDFDLQVHAVTSKGLHYNAAIQSSSAVSRDQAITIPFGASVSIQVLSSHLIVNDQSGKPVSAAGTAVMAASASSAAPTLSYIVAGKK